MKILHIIRNPNDATPLEIARSQSNEHEVAVLLLHDAVYSNPDLQVFACAADARARGITNHECVDYKRIAQMLFEYDKVVSW
jgi:sulfur transfer complex TusBCD TusB component (DsrH family)